jgi:Flp pilus assembly protein TadG
MILHRCRRRRRAVVLVESAAVYMALWLILIGLIVVGLAVFRQIQVNELAREGARWACVRGAQYAADTGNAAATAIDITGYVQSKAAGMDLSKLQVSVTWTTTNALTHTSGTSTVKNTVAVQVQYKYNLEALAWLFGVSTKQLGIRSTSVMTMSY